MCMAGQEISNSARWLAFLRLLSSMKELYKLNQSKLIKNQIKGFGAKYQEQTGARTRDTCPKTTL